MSLGSKGLGRGLGALIKDTRDMQTEGDAQHLALAVIVPNANQPRRYFADHALEDLAASIRSQGLLQPILVRPLAGTVPPRYEIVAGERRWRASKLAGLAEVPVLIRELDDQDAIAIALIENLQREDLNPIEEANGIYQLKEQFTLSQDDLAQKLGKSRSAIANILRLLNLSSTIQRDLVEGKLFAGHGRALLSINSAEAQEELHKKILLENLSVRETEALASQWKESNNLASKLENDADVEEKEGCTSPDAKEISSQKSGKRSPQSVILLQMQTRIAESVKLPVKISGKEDKGRISINYSNPEELRAIMELLGVKGN